MQLHNQSSNMTEDTRQTINVTQKSADAATAIATEAVRTARELAVKTEQTTTKLTDSMLKLSEAIIRLEGSLQYMQKDVGEIKASLDSKYVSDEAFDPVKICSKDHEKRIRNLERYLFIGLGGLSMLQVLAFLWQTFIQK